MGARLKVAVLGSLVLMAASVGVAGAGTPRDDSTTTTTATTTTTTATTTTTTAPVVTVNPFTTPAAARYLAARTNMVTAAVYDVSSGRTYLYNPGVRERTASMVKIDILADLLWESQEDHQPLTAREQSLATTMIEDSDNDSATALWNQVGGRDAIDAFNEMIGYSQTVPNYTWGAIETTPADELKLLKVIVLANHVLTTASRDYEMTLMENVASSQRFGVAVGPPAAATVGLKDGWYPETDTGWQLNSAGFVHYRGRFYLAVIMNTYNPDETYGIDTLDEISQLIWSGLRP